MATYQRRRAPWILRRRSVRRIKDAVSWRPFIILMVVASGLVMYAYDKFIG